MGEQIKVKMKIALDYFKNICNSTSKLVEDADFLGKDESEIIFRLDEITNDTRQALKRVAYSYKIAGANTKSSQILKAVNILEDSLTETNTKG